MSFSDVIGTAGVALILIAFIGNLVGMLSQRSVSYLLLNLVGAMLACFASVLIGFIPFVVLEGVWAFAALAGLVRTRPHHAA